MQTEDEEGTLMQSLTIHADQSTVPVEVVNLLEEFEDVFQEPQELPPSRSRHDHQIPFIQGADPINKRPYMYSKNKKTSLTNLYRNI